MNSGGNRLISSTTQLERECMKNEKAKSDDAASNVQRLKEERRQPPCEMSRTRSRHAKEMRDQPKRDDRRSASSTLLLASYHLGLGYERGQGL